jgi:predicted nuclease with TOPRIM domain
MKKGLGKKILKIAGMIVGAFVILFIGVGMGTSGGSVNLDGKKMDAVQLQKEIDKLKGQKKDAQKDLDAQKEKNKEVFALIDQKDEIKSDVEKEQSKLDDLKSNLNDTNSQLKSAENKLASVTGQVAKAKGAPKYLDAGKYTVGKDIPAGRYKVVATGSGSNFFVYDGEMPVVNTILGTDMGGQPSYTFECEDGNVIQTETSVKLTPVN